MSQLDPAELWRRHTLERFEAFKHSGEMKGLRKEGLLACGRKKQFTPLEWVRTPMRERYLSPRYMEWHHKCETVAQKYGLAMGTVVSFCLISGYRPDEELFPVESQWPQVRVVTDITEPQFLARLAFEAQSRGLHVISRQGSFEIKYLLMNPIPIKFLEPPPLPTSLPPLDSAFNMRVETPIGYPPQAAVKLHKTASRLEKEILAALGYPAPKRLRISRLVAKAGVLRVAEKRLPARGLYEIVANIYDESSLSDDEKRRKTVKTQRHKLRKRLVERFERSEPGDV